MKTQNFTPGPWFTNGKYIEDQHGTIAKVMRPESNATLIAAAPDLFEALKELLFMEVKGHALIDRLQFSTEGRRIADKARAALAKAKGEK